MFACICYFKYHNDLCFEPFFISRFVDSMFICLNQICGYTDLCLDIEQLRKQPYSSDDATHEKKLMQVPFLDIC